MESKIKKNLSELEKSIQGGKARLLPVSKTFPPELIMEAYEAGYREFGENRVQEILDLSSNEVKALNANSSIKEDIELYASVALLIAKNSKGL